MQAHQKKVEAIAAQVKSIRRSGRPVEFAKKSVSHFVPNPYRDEAEIPKIDLSELDELLEIDVVNKTATAESGVTFNELAKATLAQGLMPYVVPELNGITIGGAVSGCSIESMSYRFGGFHDNALEYEIVTGTGDIITASREENADIFHMMHGAYGTLGILTKLKFKLYPAKPFVKMEYHKHADFASFEREMKERVEKADYTFIDGIIHSPKEFVLCLGEPVDDAPYLSDYKWLDIFYKSTQEKSEDYLTTHDYFFRYDTECHWLTKTVPLLEMKPIRFAVGKLFLGSTNLITWSNRLRHIMRMKKRPEVVVDVFIPEKQFKPFYEWYEKDFDFFPLWIVPYTMPEVYPWLSKEQLERLGGAFVIDCAVYGRPNNDPDIDYSELIEKKVYELGGIKTLISRNHYDEETFWKIYDKKTIDEMKARLDPDNLFGEMYERFKPDLFTK